MAVFDLCFEKTMGLEGGYVLHEVPGDRGGMTYAGVARDAWPNWPGWELIDRGETSGPMLKAMVAEFYKKRFWAPIMGGQISRHKVAFGIYDFAVNAGVKIAVKTAQRIVWADADGVMGPKTIEAINNYAHDDVTANLFFAEYSLARVYRYKDICMGDRRRRQDSVKSNLKFLCGWINRVQRGVT